MLESPRISVVIVNYNFAQYLRECIDSVLAQTLPPCEIVIYDDCSTDESWDIITEYRQRLPELIVAHRQVENIGMQANGNAALRRAQGELICWLDGDDRWLPSKLEREWQALNSNRQAKIAYSNVYGINAAGQRTSIWYDGQGTQPPSGDVFIPVFCKRFFPGNRSLFRNPLLYRALLEELDYHDEDVALYIDWDLKLRLTARHAVVYTGEALVEYRIHPGGIHNQPRETHWRDLAFIYQKNRPLLAGRTDAEIARVEAEIDSLSREYGGGPLAHTDAAEAAICPAADDNVGKARALAPVDSNAMAAGLGENLIFLVSLPRSGSTLLQRILANHSDVHTAAEPWVMLHPLYALKQQGLAAEYDSGLARRALTEFLTTLPEGEEAYIEALRAMASVLYGKALAPTGKRFFLDKTPRYYYILPELRRVFPNARFVLLSRNPVAVLSSLLRTWFGDDLHALQAHQHHVDLVKGTELLARGIQTLGDAAVNVHYEDLIANPAETMARICAHVGIRFQPSMLEYGRTPAPTGSFGDPGSVHRHERVVGDYLETWRSHLAEPPFRDFTLNYIDTVGESVFETLGYSSEVIRRSICGEQRTGTTIRIDGPGSNGLNPDHCKEAHRLNKEGEDAFQQGDIELAEERIGQAYRLAPDNIEVLNNLVVLHWQKQDYVNTLNTLAEALQRQPFNRDVIVNGGQILSALGKEDDASTLYSCYLSKYPEDAEVSSLFAALSGAGSAEGHRRGSSARPDDALAQDAANPSARYATSPAGEQAPVIMIADQVMSNPLCQNNNNDHAMDPQDDDEILVSAIVSTYNSEAYIEGCLQDLMAQTIADRVEVIVVDSGSPQNERVVVERYRKQYANIRYIRTEERETIYAAWNRAVREARGKYLTNANTDDRHRHDAYACMVAELEANADVALVYADSAVTRMPNAAFGQALIAGVFRWPKFDARHLFSVCYIGPQPMWRRSLHGKYGDFDAQMTVAGDYDFWLRLASGGEHFKHLPQVLGLYLQSSESIEHRSVAEGARESKIARQRNWPAAWGQRPALSPGYLVPMERPDDTGAGEQAQVALISVIMPTKDRLALLGRALDSVIAQTYSNWELIVVNDGGQSVHGVTQGRDASDRIRLIEFDRSHGQAAARNTAFTVAKGEIVCYLDDDDVYLPHHLETIARELSTGGRSFVYTDAVVVKEKLVDGKGQEVGRSNPYLHRDYSRRRLLINNYIPINTWAHRRDCLDQIGMFDRSLSCYEDWEFLLRLSDRYEFHHVAETTVEVRHRVDQIDNVSRRRLADTADAYRLIYARHDQGLAEDVRAEREQVLHRLVENIHAWTSAPDGGHTDHDQTLPGSGSAPAHGTEEHDYQAWLRRQALSERDITRLTRHMMTDWTLQPSVHLIMTHRSGQEEALADTLDSLSAQLYGGWGLSVVSCSPCPDAMFEDMDMLEWRQVDGDLMPAVNAIVMESAADWIGLLDAGTILAPQLLFRHVDALHQHPEWRLVCTDEDRIGADGQRYDPLFKPAFNLELLRAMPYLGRFLLIEREALVAAGTYSLAPGTEAYDIVFRLAEQWGTEAMGHIADVLVHQQDRFQLARDEQAIAENRRRCVEAHLQRCAITADVRPGTLFGSYFVDYVREHRPPVDIIVPVSACTESLGLFLDSLTSMTDYPDLRIHLLVRDDVELSPELVATHGCEISRYAGSESTWQQLSELVRGCGEHIVLMTPAVIAIQSNWLERLVAQLQNAAVAVVAPRLISAGKQVVGGGFILGAGSYSMGLVAYGGLSLDEPGYMGRAQVAQEISAVSTSCLLVRKSVFESVGGVSAELRIPLYQAIDFCLRVNDAGKKIIWTPHSTLLYLGEDRSMLDGVDIDAAVTRESEAVCSRALATLAHDPAYNPNLSLTGRRFAVDDSFAPRRLYDEDSLQCVVGVGAGSIGCWKYRIQQPLRTLHDEGVASNRILPFSKELVQLPSVAELERARVDTLLMHNTMHDPYMDAMEVYKRVNRTFIVFGQDDLMYAMPPKNPFSKTIYKDVKKRLRRCLAVADRLIVTTQPLAEELSTMAEDIRVIPNYLDASIWAELQSQRGVGNKPRVGWAGAQQHLGDLELLEEVVRETADEVDWVFFGMCPEFLQPYVKEIHNPVAFGKYPQKLATLNLDLAVAPLEHNRFNECKSSLRLLEYGVLGWPVIASDIAPYRGAPVCRVHNQPRAWIKAIRERCHDLDATRQEGDVLRDWVRQNWLLQQHLDTWLAALDPATDSRQVQGEQGRAAGL